MVTADMENSCDYVRNDYQLTWRYDQLHQKVLFSLKATIQDEEFLTGVAFGTKGVSFLFRLVFPIFFVQKGKFDLLIKTVFFIFTTCA